MSEYEDQGKDQPPAGQPHPPYGAAVPGQPQYAQGQPQPQYAYATYGPPQAHPQQQWGPPGPPNPQQTRRRKRITMAFGAIALAFLLAVASVTWAAVRNDATLTTAQTKSNNPAAIAAAISPGLVNINTVLGYEGGQAAGTGIVISSDGEVITNHHVVEGATKITATNLGNGKTYTAKVVGYDATKDIAVLQLENASGLTTAAIGDSSDVEVGDAVVGVGNAGGKGGTPSYAPGQVTALDQDITATDSNGGDPENLTGLIQTNANIQPGDSGGPLVDDNSQVIGVDVAGSVPAPNGRGMSQTADRPGSADPEGYAIPINEAMAIADQIESGQATDTVHIGGSPMLGITVLTNQAAAGVVVAEVIPDGVAAKAGITAGSTITQLGGETVDSANTLTKLLEQHKPGDKVDVTWTDQSGEQHTANIPLAQGPVR